MAIANKKRKLTHVNQVESIPFDPAARQEYLTGFRKRKQQRIQTAREAAVKKEREEKLRERKELREQRKADLDKHVAEVNAELRKQNAAIDGVGEESQDEWEGFQPDDPVPVDTGIGEDEEYVDEDKYTTVTVEALDFENGKDRDEQGNSPDGKGDISAERRSEEKKEGSNGKPKSKKRKFRYETKAERNASRTKQKTKNHAAKMRRTGRS